MISFFKFLESVLIIFLQALFNINIITNMACHLNIDPRGQLLVLHLNNYKFIISFFITFYSLPSFLSIFKKRSNQIPFSDVFLSNPPPSTLIPYTPLPYKSDEHTLPFR